MIKFIICLLLGSTSSWAQTIYVPNAPGGISDIVARIVAKHTGNPQIINIPGTLAQGAARAAHSNKQMLFVETSSIIITPITHNISLTGFDKIILLGTTPNVVVVPSSSKHYSIKDLKTHQELNFGVSGTMNHLAGYEFLNAIKQSGRPIPFKSGSDVMVALMGNHIDLHVGNLSGAISSISSGKVRAIAINSPQRLSSIPEVPTVKEQIGIMLSTRGYWGIAFPDNVDVEVKRQWISTIKSLSKNQKFIDDMKQYNFIVDIMDDDKYAEWLRVETRFITSLINRIGF